MFTKKEFGTEQEAYEGNDSSVMVTDMRVVHDGSATNRAMNALLEGGKQGVQLGLDIIPGVLIICTLVMMLTNTTPAGVYTGAAYEGIGLLPAIGQQLDFIIKPLFGFSTGECIAVPITALGAAGAAIGLIPPMVTAGLVTGNDIAVFTAMCMCFSGYLSTHVSMMDSMGFREFTTSSILFHTIGGIVAGFVAHGLYELIALII